MQVQPDYSRQLEDIAKALSKPSTPPWLVTIITLVVGAALAVAGNLAFQWLNNRLKVYRMRRALYLDFVHLFYAVNGIMTDKNVPESDRDEWQRDLLKRHVRFDVEKHLRENYEVYFQLRERAQADLVYSFFHQVVEEEKWLSVNASIALQMVISSIVHGPFEEKYFRCFMKKKAANKFLGKIHSMAAYYRLRITNPGNVETKDVPPVEEGQA
jgi:hypothetical protein